MTVSDRRHLGGKNVRDKLAEFAYRGQWNDVIAVLGQKPDLVNAASTGNGYTPLHQAAWHGTALPVIGALLAHGANRHLLTKQHQSACDIARTQHPGREDLQYILSPSTRSIAQLLRKLIAEHPDLFSDYDGNRLICDRLIACLGETWVEAGSSPAHSAPNVQVRDLDARMEAALQTITGLSMQPRGTVQLMPGDHYHFSATADFIRLEVLPPLREVNSKAAVIPLEPHWTVLADLFEPLPEHWGLRGDLFLWMELRQVLCHCELGAEPSHGTESTVADRLAASVAAIIGSALEDGRDVLVRRYARGGMSSGMVSCDYWRRTAFRFSPVALAGCGNPG